MATSADRARRYRERQARRLTVLRIEAKQRTLEQLIDLRGLTDDQATDPARLALEVELMLEEYVSLLRKNRHA